MTNSSAYLVALLIACVGLTIVLGLLWWTQSQRWKSMRRAVAKADLESLAEDLPDERIDDLIDQADFIADRLFELPFRPPPFRGEPLSDLPREILEQARYVRRELQKQVSGYRGLTRRFMYVPVEGLEGRDELVVLDFLAVLQRLRHADRHLDEAISRIEGRFRWVEGTE
jgi:hypothetical protein